MYKVTKSIEFCYGHRLLDYDGMCRHLHGHNAVAEVKLASDSLDERGMVFDFGEIKRSIKTWIDEKIDHTMLLNRRDPVIPMLEEAGERFLRVDGNPTAEFIAKMIFEQARSLGFPVVSVKVWETPGSYAAYSEKDEGK